MNEEHWGLGFLQLHELEFDGKQILQGQVFKSPAALQQKNGNLNVGSSNENTDLNKICLDLIWQSVMPDQFD